MRELTYPQGQWIPFGALPEALQMDSNWNEQDYTTLTDLMQTRVSQNSLVLEASVGDQQQMLALPGPLPVPCGHSMQRKVTADKFRHIHMVMDQEGDSILCSYAAPVHKKAHLAATEWNDEWQLGAYLCTGASTFVAEFDHCAPARVQCQSLALDQSGRVTMTVQVLDDGTEAAIPVVGHLGLTTLLPPRPMSELACREDEWVSKLEYTTSQWEQFAQAR